MKLRSREVNVFSMSALDLFASAMGAFMFLAIIALPFFPNTGDSPEKVAEVKKELEETQAKLESEQEAKEALKKELAEERSTSKISFPAMDIVIALDTTGSMDAQVSGIRTEITQLADLIMKLSPDAAMGIIDFKDRCESRPINSMNITKLTSSSLGQLQGFTNGMVARNMKNCNDDFEEALDLAMEHAISMQWRSTSKAKTIIFISDNGTYKEKQNVTLQRAREFASRGNKNQISTVFVPTGVQRAFGEAYLKQLAQVGNGKSIQGGGSFTATILLALAE